MADLTSFPIATKKISELVSLTSLEVGDKLPLLENSSNTTKQITVENARNFFSPSNVVIVNAAADFPAPVAGKINLVNGTKYLINASVVIADTLVFPTGGSVEIEGALVSKTLSYTGTGVMFEATGAFGVVIIKHVILVASNGTYFSTAQTSGQLFTIEAIFASAVAGGTLKNATFTAFFSQFTNIGTGFVFENNSSQVSLSHAAFTGWRNVGTTMLTFKGNIPTLAFLDANFISGSSDTIFDLQPTLKTFGTSILFGSTTGYLLGAGATFTATSLRQSYIKSSFAGNVGIPDSTVTSAQSFSNNALASTITTINVPALINTGWTTGSATKERMTFQDICTFDGNTDIITCRNIINPANAGNHGMADGDIVTFAPSTGATLPPELISDTEYYVVGATATTFQVSLTSGGAAINLSSNGTGTNYFRHATGLSSSGWVIYTGAENTKIAIGGWVQAVTTTGGAGDNVFIQPRKTSATFVESDLAPSATVNVANAKPDTMSVDDLVDLTTGQGIRFYVVNTSNTTAVTCGRSNIIMLKA